jgi:ubiquinone/menaquinone biosynthesis C-methylase UbiE
MNIDRFQTNPPDGSDFYQWIAPVYDPLVGPFLRPVRNGVSRIAHGLGCRRILDIACGTGEQVQMLAGAGVSATGIDLSPAMLAKALSGRRQGPSFLLGDAGDLPFAAASFDCVSISLALHEMDYPMSVRVVKEALRVISNDGKLIFFDYLRPGDLTSRISLALLHIAERIAGKRHYRNFRYFISRGGLESFIQQFPARALSTREYFGGATAIMVLEKLPKV